MYTSRLLLFPFFCIVFSWHTLPCISATMKDGTFASSWEIVPVDTTEDHQGNRVPLNFLRMDAADSLHLMNIYLNTIQKSTDAGKTWQKVYMRGAFANVSLYDVEYVTPTHAIAVGDSGILLRTVDGGTTWQEQRSGYPTPLQHVAMLDSLNGVLGHLPQDGHLRRTRDGGATWEKLEIPESALPLSMFGVTSLMYPAPDCIIVALQWLDENWLLRTDDDGKTWQAYPLPDNTNHIYAASSQILYGTGSKRINPDNQNDYRQYDQIFVSHDGGKIWQYQINEITEPQWGIQFLGILDENTLVAGGENKLYFTYNGGETWTRDTSIHVQNGAANSVYTYPQYLSKNLVVCSYYFELLRIHVAQQTTTVREDYQNVPSVTFTLAPTPAVNNVSLTISLPQPSMCTIDIFDASGNKVQTVYEGSLPGGETTFNVITNTMSSGMYYLQLTTNNHIMSRPFVITK